MGIITDIPHLFLSIRFYVTEHVRMRKSQSFRKPGAVVNTVWIFLTDQWVVALDRNVVWIYRRFVLVRIMRSSNSGGISDMRPPLDFSGWTTLYCRRMGQLVESLRCPIAT